MRRPGESKHTRRYSGVNVRRDGEAVELPFAEPVIVQMTKTPSWVRRDKRRAANKRTRAARKKNRP